jgi:hypothetical protein
VDAPEAWRRFVALALDAFRSQASPSLPKTTLSNATPPKTTLPAPPSTAQMTRAMIRLARERGCGKRA